MKKLIYLFLIIILIFTGGTFLYKSYQKGKTRREEYYSETINNRSFYKKYEYKDYFHYDDKTQGDILNNNFQPQNVPNIITYGLNILIDVDNQNQSKDINNVSAQQKLTAQCDIQTIFDGEFNVYDIAVSYTMVDKHNISQENQEGDQEQQLLKQEQEEYGKDGEYIYETYEEFYFEEEETPQNYFYKLLVHADSGEILLMQIEINIEEEPILTYATQQLISDIFPELRKDSYEKSVLESDNFGTIQVDYTQQDDTEEYIIINKEYNENDYIQTYDQIDYKVNYDRDIVLLKSGIVNEGKTNMKFSFGQYNIENINLQQTQEGQDEEIETLGQITGDMDCQFWVVPASGEDEMIAKEIFRYRQELQIFKDIRLAKDLKANLEYGDGEIESFELIDINEEHEVVTISEEQIKSNKANIYFESYKKQKQQNKEKLNIGFFTKGIKQHQINIKKSIARVQQQARENQIKLQISQISKEKQAVEYEIQNKINNIIQNDNILQDKQKELEELNQNQSQVREELEKIQVILKSLIEQNQNLDSSKIVVQYKITELLNDIQNSFNEKNQIKELEERQQQENLLLVNFIQIIQGIEQNLTQQQFLQLVRQIQEAQIQSQQYVVLKSDTIKQVNFNLEQLMEISKITKQADTKSISDSDQQPTFRKFFYIIDKIKNILNDDFQKVIDHNSKISQTLKKLKIIFENKQVLPQQSIQDYEKHINNYQTFQNENINDLEQKINKFHELKDLWSEYYKIKKNPIQINYFQEKKNILIEDQINIDQNMLKLKEEIKQASEIAMNTQEILQEAEQKRKYEISKIQEKINDLQQQLENVPQQLQFELENIKNQVIRDIEYTIFDQINQIKQEIELNQQPQHLNYDDIITKVKTLGKVKVLGKQIGLDFIYNGNNIFFQIELKVKVGKKYVARVFEQSYTCSEYEGEKQETEELLKKDFTLFRAEYPVLGVITIPVTAGARFQYGFKYGIANNDQKCSLYFQPNVKASIYAEGAISIAKVVSAGIYAQGNFLDANLKLEAKKDYGKIILGLYAQYKVASLEIGVSYTKISCSLDNISKNRRTLQNIDDNQQNQLQQVRRNLWLIELASEGIKKTKQSITKVVVNPVVDLAKSVAKVAVRGFKVVTNLHKICKKDKGTKFICKFGSKPQNVTIWEQEINIGI